MFGSNRPFTRKKFSVDPCQSIVDPSPAQTFQIQTVAPRFPICQITIETSNVQNLRPYFKLFQKHNFKNRMQTIPMCEMFWRQDFRKVFSWKSWKKVEVGTVPPGRQIKKQPFGQNIVFPSPGINTMQCTLTTLSSVQCTPW